MRPPIETLRHSPCEVNLLYEMFVRYVNEEELNRYLYGDKGPNPENLYGGGVVSVMFPIKKKD